MVLARNLMRAKKGEKILDVLLRRHLAQRALAECVSKAPASRRSKGT
jgi:hypothetical protein